MFCSVRKTDDVIRNTLIIPIEKISYGSSILSRLIKSALDFYVFDLSVFAETESTEN